MLGVVVLFAKMLELGFEVVALLVFKCTHGGLAVQPWCRGSRQNEYEEMKLVNLRRSKLLDAQSSQPLTHVDGSSKRLVLHQTGEETAGEGITSTVGVVDLGVGNGVDRELLDTILALDGNEGRASALGDDGNTLALGVLLGQVGEVNNDVLGLLGRKVVRLSVGSSLGLVSDNVVPVRGAGIDGVLEELRDEGGGQGEDEGLVVGGSLLGELHDGFGADFIW